MFYSSRRKKRFRKSKLSLPVREQIEKNQLLRNSPTEILDSNDELVERLVKYGVVVPQHGSTLKEIVEKLEAKGTPKALAMAAYLSTSLLYSEGSPKTPIKLVPPEEREPVVVPLPRRKRFRFWRRAGME